MAKKTPAKGKKKNASVDEENESENEGEKSSVLEIESDASDDEDEPQMRNYLLSEIRVPEVHVQFVKRRFPDAILTADDEDENQLESRVTPVNDERSLIPPKIRTWTECAEFLKAIPYLDDKIEEETNEIPITHLTADEIENAKKMYEFIESFAAAAVNQGRLKEQFKEVVNFDKLLNALHMSGIIERVTSVADYAWVEQKFLGRWTVTPYKLIKPSEEVAKTDRPTEAPTSNTNAPSAVVQEDDEIQLTRKRKRTASSTSQTTVGVDEQEEEEPKKKRRRTSSRVNNDKTATTSTAADVETETNNNNNVAENSNSNNVPQRAEQPTSEAPAVPTPARKTRRLLQEVVAFSKDSHVVLYPWIKLDGSIDKSSLSRLKRNIFSLVHQNPGINEEKLLEKATMFRPAIIKQLVEFLLETNVIYTRSLTVTRTSLFDDVKTEHITCYFPSPNFAVLLQDM